MIDFSAWMDKGWVLAAGVVGWVYRGHVQTDQENNARVLKMHDAALVRVTALETAAATREDIRRVYDKIDSVGIELHTSQREILQTLLAARLALGVEKDAVRSRLEAHE